MASCAGCRQQGARAGYPHSHPQKDIFPRRDLSSPKPDLPCRPGGGPASCGVAQLKHRQTPKHASTDQQTPVYQVSWSETLPSQSCHGTEICDQKPLFSTFSGTQKTSILAAPNYWQKQEPLAHAASSCTLVSLPPARSPEHLNVAALESLEEPANVLCCPRALGLRLQQAQCEQ